MTLNAGEDALIAWKQVGGTLKKITADLIKAWKKVFGSVFCEDSDAIIMAPTGHSRSSKHSYTFPVQRRRRQIDICPIYRANLKLPRNLPYQRRNYQKEKHE